jgi:hypothetical protein
LERRAVRFSQARTPVPLAVSLDSGESVAATFAGENLNPVVAGFQAFFMCSAWRRASNEVHTLQQPPRAHAASARVQRDVEHANRLKSACSTGEV